MKNIKYTWVLPLFLSFNFINAQSGLVNFDALFAPTGFGSQSRPTNDYSDGFVTFTGDWKVLDCTTFFLSGFSNPNGLKFNPSAGLTSNTTSINFPSPVNQVRFNLGISFAAGRTGLVRIEAFDNQNNSLEIQTRSVLGPPVTNIIIASSNVSRIQISAEEPGILDDISYVVAAPIPTLSQWGLICLLLISQILGVIYFKNRSASLA